MRVSPLIINNTQEKPPKLFVLDHRKSKAGCGNINNLFTRFILGTSFAFSLRAFGNFLREQPFLTSMRRSAFSHIQLPKSAITFFVTDAINYFSCVGRRVTIRSPILFIKSTVTLTLVQKVEESF